MLPPVVNWTTPSPSAKYKSIREELESMKSLPWMTEPICSSWCLFLPTKDINPEKPHFLDELGDAVPDLHLNLRIFAWRANRVLELHKNDVVKLAD